MALFRQRRGGCPLAAGLFVLLAALFLLPPAGASPSREQAAEFYRYAKLLRQDLQSVPPIELGEEQYLLVIDAFRKVHRASPASSYCDDALFQAAELYREMIGRFGSKPYSAKAVAAYEFLIREYPHSKLLDRARQSIDEIEKGIAPRKDSEGPIGEPAPPIRTEVASGSSPDGAAVVPASTAANTAASAARDDRFDAGIVAVLSARSMVIPSSETPQATKRRKSFAHLRGVRHWSSEGYTRVVIAVEDRVEVSYDQLRDPKRLFFNLMETRLGEELEQEASFDVGDPFLTRIRVAQYDPRTTRVVFDLERNVYFEVSWLSNPARFVVELRGGDEPMLLTEAAPAEVAGRIDTASVNNAGGPSFADVLDKVGTVPAKSGGAEQQPISEPRAKPSNQAPPEAAKAVTAAVKEAAPPPAPVEVARVEPPPAVTLPPPKPAAANAKGQRNLIRALGLKVSRVVIDAGHGGRDTGSIGPTKLLEKDLVLDVAMRLGKLIEEGLGSEVIYTRNDDRFISLKERTKIANDAEADLFISIHANSSSSKSVRGVETYFLNFTTDSWALTVASRENAASDRSVHELQDLLSKIALKEKIEESQEFAARVQKSLHAGLSEDTKGLRDRGVRKAPFMVLIGAKMPAVLSEIGFISNPQTEKLLKTSEFRQKVANHLYQGVLGYSESLGTVSMAKSAVATSGLD